MDLELCYMCDDPTGRCGEDSMWDKDGNPLCEDCNQIYGEDAE